MAGVSRGWIPSRSPGDPAPPAERRAAPDEEEECELTLQACAGRAAPPGAPLAVRKLYLRLPRRAVAMHAALPASGGLVRLDHPALDPEALAGALRCAALDPPRLCRRLDGCGWAELCRLLDAARFLAYAPLLEGCEARLRRRLALANAVALASASHRCGAAALQREAYFFLKAHFCSAASREAPPCLTRTRIVHGEHAVPHEAWRGVRHAWARARLPLVVPQPRYTLCSLTRERRAGRVCVFKLRREHDGKLLLFARQRRAGEGEFLIFTPDGIEAQPEVSPPASPPEEGEEGGGAVGEGRVEEGNREELAGRTEESGAEVQEVRGAVVEEGRGAVEEERGDVEEAVEEKGEGAEEGRAEEAGVGEEAALEEGGGAEEEGGGVEEEGGGVEEEVEEEGGGVEEEGGGAEEEGGGAEEEGGGAEEGGGVEEERGGVEEERGGVEEEGGGVEEERGGVEEEGGGVEEEGGGAEQEGGGAVPSASTAGEAKEAVLLELTLREEPDDGGGELLPAAAAEDGVEGARLTAPPVVEQPPDPTAEREAAEAARAAERARREAEQALRREENSVVDSIWALPAEALPEHSERYCGALAATWLGLRHQLFDSGLTPEQPAHFPAPRRRELAAIVYESNVMKSRPNSMTVVVPDEERRGRGGALLDSFGNPSAERGVVVLKNLAPEWNEELEAYTLPFFQRVSLPSKKNIHIVNPDAPDDIVLLFGKRQKSITGKVTTFSLDFCRPLSTLAAFAVALSTFAGSK